MVEMVKDALRPSTWLGFVKGTVHGIGVRYRLASRKQKVSHRALHGCMCRKTRADAGLTGIALVSARASQKERGLTSFRSAFLALNLGIILAVIIITPHRIAQYMQDFADWIREMGAWGMILLFTMVGT